MAFVDVLGYTWLVRKFGRDIDAIRRIESILEGATKVGEQLSQVVTERRVLDILPTVGIRFISDSIVFVANLTRAESIDPANGKEDCIYTFGAYLSYFSSFFIAKTGLVLRGGIAGGPHYENNMGLNQFLFSWAYLRAYELEKQAEVPRLVIDRNIAKQFEALKMDWQDSIYPEKCFDIYYLLAKPGFEEMARQVLPDIREGVSRNLEYNRGKPEVLSKLIYFANYHNTRIAQADLNLPQYLIETE